MHDLAPGAATDDLHRVLVVAQAPDCDALQPRGAARKERRLPAAKPVQVQWRIVTRDGILHPDIAADLEQARQPDHLQLPEHNALLQSRLLQLVRQSSHVDLEPGPVRLLPNVASCRFGAGCGWS